MNSNQYQDGRFKLFLDNPIAGGSYLCDVPRASASAACLYNAHSGIVSLAVDEVKAQLAVMWAKQAAMEAKQDELLKENSHLKEQLTLTLNGLQNQFDNTSLQVLHLGQKLDHFTSRGKKKEIQNLSAIDDTCAAEIYI